MPTPLLSLSIHELCGVIDTIQRDMIQFVMFSV